MKKRLTLFGLFVALAAFSVHAQIYQYFSQNFETGSTQNYTVTGNAIAQTQIVSGGARSLKMTHTQGSTVEMVLDTIDLTQNATLNYFTLEFQHIAFVDPLRCTDRTTTCYIEVWRPGQSTWTRLGNTQYNQSDGGSVDFASLSSFNKKSYVDWDASNAVNNTLWKSERFDLENVFQGTMPQDRKLVVRFVLAPRNAASGSEAWYIDDIRVRASSQPIVTPRISMLAFPDHLNYPSSRGARIVAELSTTVPQGINADSVYILYTIGNRTVDNRTSMHLVPGTTNRFEGMIPFVGYDTLLHYQVVAMDATANCNTVYYPKNSSQRMTFRCVRGREHSAGPTDNITPVAAFPLPTFADNRSEWTYDSLTMATLGYKPGIITDFAFKVSSAPRTVNRPRLQIRMANVTNNILRTEGDAFTSTDMQIVYDSVFVAPQASRNSLMQVHLQDTFHYAGSDVLIQVIYDGNVNTNATTLYHIPVRTNKNSLYLDGHEAYYEYNSFTSLTTSSFSAGYIANTRPWMQFYALNNVPLVYDCGVSAMAYPSYDVPCNTGTDSVVVWLKNYGVQPLNAVRIGYKVDNGAPTYYNWTGNLGAGDSVRVLVNNSQNFTVGYHTMTAWVDDTITSGTGRFRDHEPFNDTTMTPFAACDGPYSGTRTVGTGSNAHFASLDKCLYVLSRCGINGVLTVKLPNGVYDVTKFPFIPGTSASNYVVFEPSATSNASVVFRRSNGDIDAGNAPALVDMEDARSIRFNNIKFANGRTAVNRCDVLVQLGRSSSNCQFLNCQFVDSNSVTSSATALLHSGGADSLTISRCNVYGGQVGIYLQGTSTTINAKKNVVQFTDFTNQVNIALKLENQSGLLVDSNYMNDVLTNAGPFIIYGNHLYGGSRIVRNRVYSSKGASCIGVSNAYGTASQFNFVANNMLVSLDDGTSNQLVTPLNIIRGEYLKVVFNSVRMKANSRVNIAAATLGGDTISNSYFQNNVVATFDTTNYAFNFIPLHNAANLHVDHNCYYSMSGVLNKCSSINYTNYNTWRNQVPTDQGSVVGDPLFTNSFPGTRVDLRSFNVLLRNKGVAIPGVTDDIEGTARHATTPSMGAYEVSPLQVDLVPFEFITPMEDYCGAPSNIPMKVSIRNTGIGTCSGTINVGYSIDNGQIRSFAITGRTIPAGDTIQYTLNRTENFPCNSDNSDRTYSIRWWVRNTNDPDNLNDTSVWTVISRYAPPAPSTINQNVQYAQTVTITPTAGINTWPVNYYTNASTHGRMQKSGISWYHSMTDTASFHYGPSLTTDQMFTDTTFYISQKRNLPLMKITQVQVNRTATGCTSPTPSWMNSQTGFAVQLTNCGDYPANLDGDSVLVVQTSGANKVWVLPNVTIQPGGSLVLQFKAITNVAVDSTQTLYCPSAAVVAPAYTTAFAVVYRDKHGVADAVPFNAITTATNWTSQVPSNATAIWKGAPVDLAKNGGTANVATAGAFRTSWPTVSANGTPSNTKDQWQVATAAHPMHIGETDQNLILYFDNGCEGQRSAVDITVIGRPTTDVAVDAPVVDTGCNLSTAEPVSVTIHNYGSQATSAVTVNYNLNGSNTPLGTYTISSLPARGQQTVTFAQTINMHANSDTTFHVKVWVNNLSTDGPTRAANDTNSADFFSAYSPNQPTVNAPAQVAYGNTATINTTNVPQGKATAVWYDAAHQVLDTVRTGFVTPHIYHNPDTFYVKAIGLRDVSNTHVGTLATVMSNNFPSPYNPKMQYVHEQYLYTADQIAAAGHTAGTISSLSFYLTALGSNVNSFTFSDYTIKLGTTTQTTYANGNFLTAANAGLQQVYSRTNYTLNASNIGWVKHELDTPFQWDGTSSIVVDITRTLSTAGINAGANTQYTAQANTVITKSGASNSNNATLGAPSGSKVNNRPDIKIGFLEAVGCESTEQQVTIGVSGLPGIDANIEWPAELDTMVIASCAATPLNVKLNSRGQNALNAYTLSYKVDNGSWQTTSGNANGLAMGYSRNVPLMSQALTPGRHTVIAAVRVTGDTVYSNDTIIRTFNVRFCAGSYTIGTDMDYPTMEVAFDTLQNAGVAGPVTFHLSQQTFNQQLQLGTVDGTSDSSRVTFTTTPTATEPAMITFNPTSANNFVMALNGTKYVTFDNINFYAGYTGNTGTSATANVLRLENTNNVAFRNCIIRSKASKAANGNITATSANANLMLLGDNNSYLTVDSCVLDSGYYAIRTLPTNTNSWYLTFSNNQITNFLFQGIRLNNCDTVFIEHDSIATGTSIAGKAMTGIYVANGRNISVKRNFVLLMDNATGGKRGIQLCNIKGTNIDRSVVYNNMVSLKGSAVASLSSAGIWIDSTSKYMNVYFNSVRLYSGANQAATRTFSVSKSTQIYVMNNVFDNESKGYAYYVDVDTNVAISNYNAYWSNAEVAANGSRKFIHWGNVTATADRTCIDSLRVYNHQDVNSLEEQIYFKDERDLSLALAQFSGLGQYNPDVMVDIFNTTRNQIPPPTIGCHEFYTRSCNLTIAAIIEPHWPTAITGNNAEVLNIETDSILVRVKLYNNGSSPLRNVTWHAYIGGTDPRVISYTRTIRSMPVRSMVEDSLRLASPLGIQDSQWCVVVADVDTTSGLFDNDMTDNIDSAKFFIYPAYDLKVTSVSITDNTPAGCRLFSVPINYVIKNEGKKDFPADFTFQLGYDFYVPNVPAGFTSSNYPGMSISPSETFGTVLPVGTDLPITINAQYNANMYPTGYLGDLRGTNQVKLRGWVRYENDIKTLNDTSNYINVVAKHTPPAPVGSDTTIDYGSYGVLWATETDGPNLDQHRVIRWCRDTTSGETFYNGTNNYTRSTHWSTTPQYFHDSTYYLCCISDQGCTSYYSNINVAVNPPLAHDVSISEVLSPRASGRVYTEVDTVRLRVANYGSEPATNIPITYEFYTWASNRTTLRQTCTDTIRATIPGRVGDNVSYFDFVFDTSLLNLKALNPNVPLTAITYKLNAWVTMSGDMQTNNDTLHQLHTFTTLPESKYNFYADSVAPTAQTGFDISHVSFNSLDTWMPDMIGYKHLWLGNYNAANAEIPTAVMRRGTKDTLTVEVANNLDEMDTSTAASLMVVIDYNRDGVYDMTGSENITKTDNTIGVKVHSRRPFKMEYTIPDDCHFGYMRMMVFVVGDSNAYLDQAFPTQTDNGQMQEYLIFVQEPGTEDSVDAVLTRMVTPNGPIVTENDHYVGVMLANKGRTELNSATINYNMYNDNGNKSGHVDWTGTLAPGQSELVMFDSLSFNEGTTDFQCFLHLPGDSNVHNTLEYRFHRYYVLTLRFIDSFDQLIDKWYVPAGYNNYTRNYWNRTTPAKGTISTAASLPNAYVTDATRTIQSGTRGNRSVLYLPIINIAQIHPDSISLALSKNLTNESYVWMEYFNYENKWVKMDDPGARYDQDQSGWYDDANGWTGSTSAGAYETHSISTSSTGVSGDFPQRLRLRLIYSAPQGATNTASYGDGCAIDNFRIGRARRAIDVGVTEITHPTDPRFGQTIWPKVKIKNFGTGPMVNFKVAYRPWGTYLPMEEIVTDSLYPDQEIEFEFRDPFIVRNDFPDTFEICAFTKVSSDYYDDNDTTCQMFGLAPLDNDMYMYEILEPLDRAVAGDSVFITVRLRNFGQAEVPNCDVAYKWNDNAPVVEHIDFVQMLGHPLASTEFFNYTFRHHERASMGTMQLTTWVDYSNDAYRYNDTTSMQIGGISAITDIRSTEVVVNNNFDNVQINLVLDNVGARMANDFLVGFWYDNDTNTKFEETFHREGGLAAGGRAVHAFSNILSGRSAPWEYVTAYCVVPDDYNPGNDTSVNNLAEKTSDIAAIKVEVEENRDDMCRVRMQVCNLGNTTWNPAVSEAATQMMVTINGNKIRMSDWSMLEPGVPRYINFNDKVPKDPNRHYAGKGELQIGDNNPANNSTSRVEVVNYFEGIPTAADDGGFTLEQNYPNPFDGKTSIEFSLPAAGTARFFVTDVVGRLVYEQSANYEAGRQSVTFDRSDMAAGVYYYAVEFNGETRMHKMIVR